MCTGAGAGGAGVGEGAPGGVVAVVAEGELEWALGVAAGDKDEADAAGCGPLRLVAG